MNRSAANFPTSGMVIGRTPSGLKRRLQENGNTMHFSRTISTTERKYAFGWKTR